jgi:hypothetical protein
VRNIENKPSQDIALIKEWTNRLVQGCYDGLEENYVNLNQSAESTVSYLMTSLTVEKFSTKEQKNNIHQEKNLKINV